jgi:CMP-N,N'-diacetyllegionaminic acid synthase
MRRLAIIPARSGSKGLKDKNIKELNGKPLIAYTIQAALESRMFDKIFVSTDSEKYARIAVEWGACADFLRSKENSSDTAGSWDVAREVVERLEEQGENYDEIMLLQATSPLRTAYDICTAIELMQKKSANSVVSLTPCKHSPLWCNTLPEDGCMDSFENEEYKNLPRQLLPCYYQYNGAIYLLTMEELYKKEQFRERCYAYIMPEERSVDIDTELDFVMAEYLLNREKVE